MTDLRAEIVTMPARYVVDGRIYEFTVELLDHPDGTTGPEPKLKTIHRTRTGQRELLIIQYQHVDPDSGCLLYSVIHREPYQNPTLGTMKQVK